MPRTVRYIPSWFPGAEFKRKAIEWREDSVAMLEEPFEMVKQKIVNSLYILYLYKRILMSETAHTGIWSCNAMHCYQRD